MLEWGWLISPAAKPGRFILCKWEAEEKGWLWGLVTAPTNHMQFKEPLSFRSFCFRKSYPKPCCAFIVPCVELCHSMLPAMWHASVCMAAVTSLRAAATPIHLCDRGCNAMTRPLQTLGECLSKDRGWREEGRKCSGPGKCQPGLEGGWSCLAEWRLRERKQYIQSMRGGWCQFMEDLEDCQEGGYPSALTLTKTISEHPCGIEQVCWTADNN